MNRPPPGPAAPVAWHTLPTERALEALGSSALGLSSVEAASRLRAEGPNRLRRTRPASALRVLGDQLRSLVVALLVAATLVSLAIGDWIESAAIGAVLAINTLLGFATELRARRAMEALAEFDLGQAVVLRDGRLAQVDSSELVRGDVIELAAGQRVPADARMLVSHDLHGVEAALTGESMPAEKDAGVVLAAGTPLAERRNMVYKGTTTAAGAGRAVVTATGAGTEIGRIGELVSGLSEERTPLERKLDALGRKLAWLALGVAALVAGLGALQGAPPALVLELGIALAVAAVPEALPAVSTIALAVGLHRMARRHALVRRLPAVEALGATTVVCTDKTRTLTSGEMTVVETWSDGAAASLLEASALACQRQPDASDADRPSSADPVDRAILEAFARAGADAERTLARRPSDVLPFSSQRQLLARYFADGERTLAYVKGAPRRILSLCTQLASDAGPVALDDAARARVVAANEALAARGLRVLACARGEVRGTDPNELAGLELVGLIGLMDPPAEGVHETIARLRAAGLRTIMLTGDQRLTAETIGRQLGLIVDGGATLEGRDLDALDAEALRERVADTTVFSRISPEHKLRIVEALQSRGEIVAMLGDGVNDAPALKRAAVGVAMGRRGTDVAREAADIVLRDDRFETIAAAVEEGRTIDANIRKFVFYLFSCNAAEILVLLLAALAGLPHPLAPLQILWLNLVTDTFPALALAMEPADRDVMSRPPRAADEELLSRRFLSAIALYGALITAVTLAAFWSALPQGDEHARTVAFMTLGFAQILHLGNARSPGAVLRPSRALANRWALAAVATSVALQVAAFAVPPLADLLRVAPLSGAGWLRVLGLGALPALVGQALKSLGVRWRA